MSFISYNIYVQISLPKLIHLIWCKTWDRSDLFLCSIFYQMCYVKIYPLKYNLLWSRTITDCYVSLIVMRITTKHDPFNEFDYTENSNRIIYIFCDSFKKAYCNTYDVRLLFFRNHKQHIRSTRLVLVLIRFTSIDLLLV